MSSKTAAFWYTGARLVTLCLWRSNFTTSVRLSVCSFGRSSVRLSHADIQSKRLNIIKLFHRRVATSFQFFRNKQYCHRCGPPAGASNLGVWKNRDFRPISRFISKWYKTEQSYSYNGRLSHVACRMAPFSVTLNDPDFTVTPLFDAECLRNATWHRHSFNGILIETYTRPTQQCHFKWPSVTLSDLAKHSMTEASRGLFATAEFLVFVDTFQSLYC